MAPSQLAQQLHATLNKKPSASMLLRKNTANHHDVTRDSSPKPLKTIRMIPHSRNDKFYGRDRLLHDIHAALSGQNTRECSHGCPTSIDATKPDSVHSHRRHVLHGLGGSGKTQVAIEYSYRHFHDYKAIIWILADSPDKIHQSFVEAADQLGLDRSKNHPAKKFVFDTLRATDDQYLLVFDNVDDFTLVKDYLPPTPNGATLITTRDSISCEGLPLELSHVAFSVDQGADFLDSLVPRSATSEHDRHRGEACLRISTIFHGYPLALSQVAGFIETGACTLHNFESLLQDVQTTEALAKLSLDSSSLHVAQTRDLSHLSLASLDEDSRKILDILAYLDPDSTPMELFTEGVKGKVTGTSRPSLAFMGDRKRFDNAINGLQRQSFIRTNTDLATLSIHRITQKRSLMLLNANETLRRSTFEDALYLLANATPQFTNYVQHWSPELWQNSETYVPHIKKMEIEFLQTPAVFKGCENQLAQVMYQSAAFEFERTYFTTASRSFAATKTVIAMASQPDILLLCDCCRTEGRMYNEMNRPSEAKMCGMEARRLADTLVQLGMMEKSDPRMIRILTGLGNTLSGLEEWDEAQAVQEEALELSRTLTNTKSDVGIAVEKNMAWLALRRGRLELAERLFLSSIEKDKTLAPAWYGLGNTYLAQNRIEDGMAAHMTSHKYYSDLFGKWNYIVADCKYKIGSIYLQHLEDYEKALEFLHEAFEIYLAHQEYFDLRGSIARNARMLAMVMLVAGQEEEAEDLFEEAFCLKEEVTGERGSHDDTDEEYSQLVFYWAQ